MWIIALICVICWLGPALKDSGKIKVPNKFRLIKKQLREDS